MNKSPRSDANWNGVILLKLKLMASGAAAGLICGIFGAGGGMVLVPLLLRLCGMEPREAFASSLCVMLPVCAVSLAVLWLRGGFVAAGSLPYLCGGVAGGILAGIFYQKIPTALLRRIMGAMILWGGLRLLWN